MRLIDADALYEDMLYEMCGTGFQSDALSVIRRAPTITPPPNAPLTLEELREMDDADVWVAYPPSADGEQLILHALVEVVKENGVVWLTNNLGCRSIFDEVCDDGGVVYRHRPEEETT